MEQREHGFKVWQEPFVPLRFPSLYNLRSDPFERAAEDATMFYRKWSADRMSCLCLLRPWSASSCGNQFFDEARFESYRMLGFHTVLSIAGGLRNLGNAEALCDAAQRALADQAHARPPVGTPATMPSA